MSDPAAVPSVTQDRVGEDAFILDVREPDEWEAGHVPGALHIPLGQVGQRLQELPEDREIVVTCRGGGRSARAVVLLQESGHRAVNLEGGMRAWAAADRVMTSERAEPPTVI